MTTKTARSRKARTEEGTLIDVDYLIASDGEVMVTLVIGDEGWVFPKDAALRLAAALQRQAAEGEGQSRSLYGQSGMESP